MTVPVLTEAEVARFRAEVEASRTPGRYVPAPPPHRPNPDADPALAGFRALLRGHRVRRGWSQITLALEADCDHSLVSRIEAGHRSPTRETIGKLAAGMRLTPAQRDALLVAADYKPDNPAALLADEPVVTALYQALTRGGLASAVGDALRAAVGGAVVLAQATTQRGKE